ncbi:MAG: hypothetical protein OJF52_000865 [Nitrospira sp.]|nr:MAG: hypothetical protein OJF52_000865 [Nitrospira sp.]
MFELASPCPHRGGTGRSISPSLRSLDKSLPDALVSFHDGANRLADGVRSVRRFPERI